MTMTWKKDAVFAFVISLALDQAWAQEVPTPPRFPIVLSGERTSIFYSYALNKDCTPMGKVVVRAVQGPKNGLIEIVTEEGHSDYKNDDQRFKCNEKTSEVVRIYYKSNDGFKGRTVLSLKPFTRMGVIGR